MEKEMDINIGDNTNKEPSKAPSLKPSTLCALWLVALLDRGNIGSANIFGIQKDLHMQGNDFNIALLIVVIVLIVFEIPCNALLKFSSPQIVLTGEIFLLGITGIGEGLVTNVAGFNAMRFFVGLFEAGIIPGIAISQRGELIHLHSHSKCLHFESVLSSV
ncbi:hypothetical protein OCU04_006171 [Sclerotinia nivalis]|uniref:Uncharacterized protein n=1 Tax=Sclerotinia nivalis TaxID=352851 RepID=A0A9X0DKA3_9HELO|nr:hypothetical protein OCU04_006171 [Sclerotinia nivalis]